MNQQKFYAASKLIRLLFLVGVVLIIFIPSFPQSFGGDPGLVGLEVRDREQFLHRLKFWRSKHPDDPEISYQIGNLYYSLKMQDDAIKEYRRCLRLKPDHFEAKWFLSKTLADKGYLDEAFRLARELLEAKPDDPETYAWAGEILLKMGLPQFAKDYFRRWEELLWLKNKGKPLG